MYIYKNGEVFTTCDSSLCGRGKEWMKARKQDVGEKQKAETKDWRV